MGTFNSSQRNCWLVLLSQPRQPDGSFLSAETATQNALEMSDCLTSPNTPTETCRLGSSGGDAHKRCSGDRRKGLITRGRNSPHQVPTIYSGTQGICEPNLFLPRLGSWRDTDTAELLGGLLMTAL